MEQENKEKIDQLWNKLFELQHRSCNEKLCLLDVLQFNDIKSQLKLLGEIKE